MIKGICDNPRCNKTIYMCPSAFKKYNKHYCNRICAKTRNIVKKKMILGICSVCIKDTRTGIDLDVWNNSTDSQKESFRKNILCKICKKESTYGELK